MNEDKQEEIKAIIKSLEAIGEQIHPYEARHIDEAVMQLKYYLDDFE